MTASQRIDGADEASGAVPALGEIHRILYEAALKRGRVLPETLIALSPGDPAATERAIAEMLELHLLVQSLDDSSLTPSSPEVAASHLTGPIEAEVQRHRRQAEQIRAQLLTLNPIYIESRQSDRGHSSLDVLGTLEAVRAELGRLSSACSTEVFSSHPMLPPVEALEEGAQRTETAIGAGVTVRTLYPHSVLAHHYMQAHLQRQTEAGAQVRTVGQIPDRVVIFDRQVAVLPDRVRAGQGVAAIVVHEPAVVEYLLRTLESLWSTARPFTVAPNNFGYGDAKDDMRRAILELLAAGHKDEVVARRLSISVRACRRQIAEMMTELGAASRFQAGYLAPAHGLLPTPAR